MLAQPTTRPLRLAGLLLLAGGAAAQAPLFAPIGAPQDWLGFSVAAVGDLDHDGLGDFAIAAPALGGGPGRVDLYSGATFATLRTFTGPGGPGDFGYAVDGAGDVDGDGTPDLLVGEPDAEGLVPYGGRLWVFSGADGSALHQVPGGKAFENFGAFLAGTGDTDGDGLADFAAFDPVQQAVVLFSGGSGGELLALDASNPFSPMGGAALAGVGDLDGDGHADVAVGWEGDQVGFKSLVGSAWVFSGDGGRLLHAWHGAGADHAFGNSVAGAGDIDLDGVPDVIVGAWLDDQAGTNFGSAQVFSGATGEVLHLVTGPHFADGFGWDVAGAGDADADGWPDFAVSGVFAQVSPADTGSVSVYSGRGGARLRTLTGGSFYFFGRSIAGLPDLDGDGAAELLVGSNNDNTGGSSAGRAWVFGSGAWLDLGGALAGAAGPPQLAAQGTLQPGSDVVLRLAQATTGSSAFLVFGPGVLGAPLLGGTLGPEPLFVGAAAPVGTDGTLALRFDWPDGLPPGSEGCFQWWIVDAAAPQGYAASNSVLGTQP